jgi:hypothetical protein
VGAVTPPDPDALRQPPVLAIAPSNWRLLWLGLRTGFLYGAIMEGVALLGRAAGLLRPIPGLILLFCWGVQANFMYATGRDRRDGYLGGAVAALLLASLFGLLTSLGVARSGGDPAWGWLGFAFSLIVNWGAAVERRMKDRRTARALQPPPPSWRRVPWYSWSFLGMAIFTLAAAIVEPTVGFLLFAIFGLAFAALLVTASWRGWIAPD